MGSGDATGSRAKWLASSTRRNTGPGMRRWPCTIGGTGSLESDGRTAGPLLISRSAGEMIFAECAAPATPHVRAAWYPAVVFFNGKHDAFVVGNHRWSVDLVRRPVGRIRHHRPASHRGPDEAPLREVLQM